METMPPHVTRAGREQFWVYILANCTDARVAARPLYVGVTGDLDHRLAEHRARRVRFTARFAITELVYVETFSGVEEAIRREKEIKGWRRQKKVALIEMLNPAWRDLAPKGRS